MNVQDPSVLVSYLLVIDCDSSIHCLSFFGLMASFSTNQISFSSVHVQVENELLKLEDPKFRDWRDGGVTAKDETSMNPKNIWVFPKIGVPPNHPF